MAYSKKEREQYNKSREHTSKDLGLSKNEYNYLRRISQALNKYGTDNANGDTEEKEYFKNIGQAFSKTKKFKGKLHFHHQTDPRGVALYAAKEKIRDTDYSSKGRPIY